MKRAPQGRYTREFRQEAVKLVKGGGILGHAVSMVSENVRLSGQRKRHLYCSR